MSAEDGAGAGDGIPVDGGAAEGTRSGAGRSGVEIARLWPDPVPQLDDEGVLATYAPPEGPWLRMNFVASLDGAVTRDGRSGGLGGEADRRVFQLLRRQADVVLVGAGTVRAEGYDGMRLSDSAVRWRVDRGLPEQPVFAIVSRKLDLDPSSSVFVDAPRRPIVYTVESAPEHGGEREALARVADVVSAGASVLDPAAVRRDLADRGLMHVHSEGGPHLFGSFVEAGAVDELCLTVAPSLEAGRAGRIAVSPHAAPTGMRPAALLKAGDELFLRYVRA